MRFLRYFKDVLRFNFNQLSANQNKICFYCEGKNYWPHLKPIVVDLLETTDEVINYVTSDESDPAFKINNNRFNTYLIGDGFIRNYFFDNLNSELVVMTMPDLDQYQVKKSKKVKKFIFVHHSLVSHHMVYRPKAFDAFDVIMCAGPHHNAEIEAMVNTWDMPPKKLINHGYGRLDSIIANSKERPANEIKKILIAPSWGENGTIELMGEKLVDALMQLPYEVVLRPHPQTHMFAKNTINRIKNKYQNNAKFTLDIGVDSEKSLHESDLMISDWSGAALDYAFGLLKPVLFIDVPRKIQNKAYQQLQTDPFEVSIREQIGLVQSMDLAGLEENILQLINNAVSWTNQLQELRQNHVYHIGNSGQQAAKAIKEML